MAAPSTVPNISRERLKRHRLEFLASVKDVHRLVEDLKTNKEIHFDEYVETMCKKEPNSKLWKGDITNRKRLRALVNSLLWGLEKNNETILQYLYQTLLSNGEQEAAHFLYPQVKEIAYPQVKAIIYPNSADPELPKMWPVDNLQTVTVTPVTDETMKKMCASAAKDDPDGAFFSLQNERVLLIINNSEFSPGLTERIGSEKDAEALKNLFHQLDFEVIVIPNRSAKEMLQDVSEVCKRQTISCFACAILSHGGKECIFGADGKKMFLTELLHAVSNEMSPNLKGKPKLFFIQACQGNKHVVVEVNQPDAILVNSTEVNLEASAGEDAEDSVGKDAEDSVGKDAEDSVGEDAEDSIAEISDDIEKALGITEADGPMAPARAKEAFIAMATVPDFVSYRHTTLGSWFIQALVFVISKLAHKMELNHLMTRVNRLVGRAATRGFGQIAIYNSTMTKDFYFFPGLLKK